ncbi:MAG: transposase zinc-binding domain-containing protein [Vulcanimicrobiota bacterium]
MFTENWESFKKKYPAYDMEYYDEVVNKMLGCGDPANGFIEYRCMDCWEERRIIPFSCKCTFCLTCGKVYADNSLPKLWPVSGKHQWKGGERVNKMESYRQEKEKSSLYAVRDISMV